MPGHRLQIWKQDPSVESIGIRWMYVNTPVEAGPKDAEIEVVGDAPVPMDEDNDFVVNWRDDPKAFDAVHCYGVARHVLTMYQRALRRTESPRAKKPWAWQWGREPIKLYPRAGEDRNAYYQRTGRRLAFYYFPDQKNPSETIYTCESFDIVSHEMGHAVLDALQPDWLVSTLAQTAALHESFGDLTAIFSMLAQADQCEAIVSLSKTDLHDTDCYVSEVAEQFGLAGFGQEHGLRNVDLDLTLADVAGKGPHQMSLVFTGAVYDALARLYQDHLKFDEYDPVETLFRIGKHMTALTVRAFELAPATNATFADVATQMVALEPEKEWKQVIQEEFERRQVLGAKVLADDARIAAPLSLACGCTTLDAKTVACAPAVDAQPA